MTYNLPSNTRVAQSIVQNEHELDKQKLKLGKLGNWFGDASHAPLYLSVIIAILLIGVVFMAVLVPDSKQALVEKMFRDVLPLVSAVIGYLFGSKSAV